MSYDELVRKFIRNGYRMSWGIPGPKGTQVKYMVAFIKGPDLVIVEEFKDGGGFAFFNAMPTEQIDKLLSEELAA